MLLTLSVFITVPHLLLRIYTRKNIPVTNSKELSLIVNKIYAEYVNQLLEENKQRNKGRKWKQMKEEEKTTNIYCLMHIYNKSSKKCFRTINTSGT
jgi:hypothetical protein